AKHAQGLIVVPDLTNKTMQEVTSVISQLGLTPQHRGDSGVAYEQEPQAGSVVSKGMVVRVSYR
ncbi:MAG: PASTA domain-containing protein, partial [Symbiobacteriaceae bacterium]|nr:PASTA domain-containing protein [Symbiobacteriaceae bacterium]